jgi:hypothetical protein
MIDGSTLWIVEYQRYGHFATYGQIWILIRYGKHGSEKIHNNIFTIGISGISEQLELDGHRKESSERHNRIGKEKPSSIIRKLLNNMVK